jgi:8-oxo-dGTP pyrophosphatase MutT (NUDIX family)
LSEPRLEQLLEDLASVNPIDEREAASIREILRTVPRLAAPFSETADPTHLTASAFVVGTRGTVLHRHRKLGIWVQPGGHVDGDEWPAAASMREAAEETGLPLAQPPGGPLLLHVDVHPGPRGHTHLDLRYVLLAPASDPAPGLEESQEVLWLSYDEARSIADPSLKGGLDKLERAWVEHEPIWREKVEAMSSRELPDR